MGSGRTLRSAVAPQWFGGNLRAHSVAISPSAAPSAPTVRPTLRTCQKAGVDSRARVTAMTYGFAGVAGAGVGAGAAGFGAAAAGAGAGVGVRLGVAGFIAALFVLRYGNCWASSSCFWKAS